MNPFRLPRWRFMNCCGHSWDHSTEPRPGTDGQGASRRDFVKAAASGAVGLAALATLKDTVAAQVRVFPPPPPAVSPIEGLIDFHNHCAPDVFGRAVDDDEMAQLYLARKMEAVVLKNHVALTADRAWLVRKHNPGIKAFGGVTLNSAAGGINPDAVQWMWRMQGGYGRSWSPMLEVVGARELVRGTHNEWHLVPQIQISLSRRQHVMLSAGLRVPVNDRDSRPKQFMMYVLWDWFDGGLFSGW